jgi:hypothetical protein
MFAIDDATAVAAMPTPEAAGTAGFFTEGNPALGQAATYLRASFLNGLMQELLNVLTGAGVTPSKTTYDQLLKALRSNALVVATDTGAANAAVLTYAPAIAALTDGMVLWFKAAATNTGATTLNVNGLGAKAVVGGGHAALQGGEILANGKCQVVWSATLNSFVLIECTGGALQVAAGTQSSHAARRSQFLAPITASNTVSGTNVTLTAVVSFTAPGPGTLIAFGSRNVGGTTSQINTGALYIDNGTGGVSVAADNTPSSMTHFGARALVAGATVSASYQTSSLIAFSANVFLIWIPAGLI